MQSLIRELALQPYDLHDSFWLPRSLQRILHPHSTQSLVPPQPWPPLCTFLGLALYLGMLASGSLINPSSSHWLGASFRAPHITSLALCKRQHVPLSLNQVFPLNP